MSLNGENNARAEPIPLRVTSIPKVSSARDVWEALSFWTEINYLQIAGGLSTLGRQCMVYVPGQEAAHTLQAASNSGKLYLGEHPVHIRPLHQFYRMPYTEVKLSKRRVFLVDVPASITKQDLAERLKVYAGPIDSIKQITPHACELILDSEIPNTKVYLVQFQQEHSARKMIHQYSLPLGASGRSEVRVIKNLYVKIDLDRKKLKIPSTQDRLRYSKRSFDDNTDETKSKLKKYRENKLRIDINDNFHRKKPTSRKYFVTIEKRQALAFAHQDDPDSGLTFNIGPSKRRDEVPHR